MKYWQELMDILTAEKRLLGELTELGRKKQRILLDGQVAELEKIIGLEETLILKQGRLEDQRQKVQQALAAAVPTLSAEAGLKEMVPAAPPELQPQLRGLQEELVSGLQTLQQINEQNELLIKQSLAFINYNLELLAGQGPAAPTYGTKNENEQTKHFFDTKA